MLLLRDSAFKIPDKLAKVAQSFLSKVLRGRCILLDALQVLNRQEGLFPLLVNDRSKPVILLLNFLYNFLFDALLLKNCRLHLGALRKCILCLAKELLELADLVCARLLEGHTSAAATV